MSALRPDSNEAHDLGTSSIKWGTIHVSDVQAATLTTSGNVEVQGNLTVTGTSTSLQVSNLDVEDPLIKLARGNSSDAIDIGFYGLYNDGADKYAGLVRDANDSGKFKLLEEITSEPSSTVTGGSAATLVADIEGALTGNATTATALATGRNFGITSGPIRAANVSFDGSGNVALTSSIADDQITNAMLANPGLELKLAGASQETIELGGFIDIGGTANELEVSYSTSDNKYTFGLPSAVSGLSSVSATSLVGALTGNASTATALESARTFAIGAGPIRAAAVSFDGTGNLSLTSSIADDQITNAMLANDKLVISVDGVAHDRALGSTLKFAASGLSINYSAVDNELTYTLPSSIASDTSGNAGTATALESAQNIGITAGPVRAANVSFDGSGAVALTSTIADSAITNAMLAQDAITFAGDSGSTALQLGDTFTISGSANEIVSAVSGDGITLSLPNDVSGLDSVSATSLVGALTGNASTATALATGRNFGITGGPVRAANVSFDGSGAVAFTSSIADDQITNDMLANPSLGFGDGSTPANYELGKTIVIQGTSNEIEVSANHASGGPTFTVGLPNTITAALTGNADTATALATARNVGITGGPVTAANISFDGSGNVAMTSAIANDAITNAMIANDHLTLAADSGTSNDIDLGGTLTLSGTSDEIETSVSGDTITIGLPSDVTIADDLAVGGNITSTGNVVVGGNLTAAAATVTLGDTLLELGVNNTSAKDHGFYSQRGSSSFCGFFFDETDDKFKVFTHDTEPSSDVVAVSGNYTKGNMDVGAVEVTSLDSSGLVAGQLRMEGDEPASASADGTAGDMRFDSGFIYVCVSTNTWKRVSIGSF